MKIAVYMYINVRENFVLSPLENHQGLRFIVSSERLSSEYDYCSVFLLSIPLLSSRDSPDFIFLSVGLSLCPTFSRCISEPK